MPLEPQLSRQQRWFRMTQNPELMDVVYSHVANGGSVIELTASWDIPYHWLTHWVRKDPMRTKTLREAQADRLEWTVEKILEELRVLAHTDIREILEPGGAVKPACDWPAHIARAVSSMEISELYEGHGQEKTQVGWTKKIKLWDKQKALDLLAKSTTVFKDQIEVSGKATLEEIIAGAKKVIDLKLLPSQDLDHGRTNYGNMENANVKSKEDDKKENEQSKEVDKKIGEQEDSEENGLLSKVSDTFSQDEMKRDDAI